VSAASRSRLRGPWGMTWHPSCNFHNPHPNHAAALRGPRAKSRHERTIPRKGAFARDPQISGEPSKSEGITAGPTGVRDEARATVSFPGPHRPSGSPGSFRAAGGSGPRGVPMRSDRPCSGPGVRATSRGQQGPADPKGAGSPRSIFSRSSRGPPPRDPSPFRARTRRRGGSRRRSSRAATLRGRTTIPPAPIPPRETGRRARAPPSRDRA